MALFIAQLAFADARLLAAAKIGVLAASGGAAMLGWSSDGLLLSSKSAAGRPKLRTKRSARRTLSNGSAASFARAAGPP